MRKTIVALLTCSALLPLTAGHARAGRIAGVVAQQAAANIAEGEKARSSAEPRPSDKEKKSSSIPSTQRDERLSAGEPAGTGEEAAIQSQINSVYQSFYNSYRLGPGDIIGIYIDKHPEDSVDKVTVSPVGRIYFPLLGDLTVVGKTLPQLQDAFNSSVAEYIKDPRITLALLEAHSAKFGVLGDVRAPGMMMMTKPTRLLDAITMAGGITDTGSAKVSILRQYEDGRVQVLQADMKRILKGKSSPEENLYLRAGDTVIVHGNIFKTVGKISSFVGLASFAAFMARGGY
ncbi:MAG TPA: polysaccharide biosynthesis/export family protein [Blastocatellia bacterium]|nr:polysaccharide biosynthesis/export family protein [Blastocatellia bacterium]